MDTIDIIHILEHNLIDLAILLDDNKISKDDYDKQCRYLEWYLKNNLK